MRLSIIKLFAKQFWNSKMKSKHTFGVVIILNLLLFSSLYGGFHYYHQQQQDTAKYSHEVRENWDNNPAKHPHRMAHYGYIVFRQRFPLSFFDFGMDSYLGNAVFLEAHKQNTVNFSEASLSNSLLRFGEISAGLVLQLLIPLLIYFWGYDSISREREHGVLQLLLIQGANWNELVTGKVLGLFSLVTCTTLPTLALTFILLFVGQHSNDLPIHLHFFTLVGGYFSYFLVLSFLTVLTSAFSKSSKLALIRLIGFWLVFSLVFPKVSQVAGQIIYPSPSKIEFDTTVEKELLKQGNSHNPDDPHFKALKDSLLATYQVDSVHKLPFNYSGFVMKEGERLSAETFVKEQQKLINTYQKQQSIVKRTAFINPYIAIKNLSMAFSGTDYTTYTNFQNQAESYRYLLAQTMNELQMKHIGNDIRSSSDKRGRISRQHWIDFPEFEHQFLSFGQVLQQESTSISALLLWLIGLFILAKNSSKYLKAL